jgi:hypothetical protein
MATTERLPQPHDAERARQRLGTAFIEHVADLWPEGEPAATPEWIRARAFDIRAVLELARRQSASIDAPPSLAALAAGRA